MQQALLPVGCVVFDNPVGTAPGCAFQEDGVHVLMLPGPPFECRYMFEHRAAPSPPVVMMMSARPRAVSSAWASRWGLSPTTV